MKAEWDAKAMEISIVSETPKEHDILIWLWSGHPVPVEFSRKDGIATLIIKARDDVEGI